MCRRRMTSRQIRGGLVWLLLVVVYAGCQSKKPTMDLPIYNYPPETFFEGEALPVARAIRQNDTTTLVQLLHQKRVDLNYVGKEGMTFLLWAYEHQLPDCLRVLVQQGADINQTLHLKSLKTGYFYDTHLIYIASVGPSEQMLRTIIGLGANMNLGQDGEQPLLKTVYTRQYDRMWLLIEAGADINYRFEQFNSVLFALNDLNQFELVVRLIERGAKFDEPTHDLALSLQETGADAPENQIWQRKLKRMLIERGVHFPVPRPYEQKYIPIETQWAQTPEGRAWEAKVNRMGANPEVVGQVWQQEREGLMTALKQWMVANHIEEPEDPPYVPEKN